MNTPDSLLDRFRRHDDRADGPALWWLGQHGFVVKGGGATVFLDAYLAPNPRRLVPPALPADAVAGVDLFIGTHDHSDHIDRATWPVLARNNPSAPFAVPDLVRDSVGRDLSIPPARLIGMNDGVAFQVGGMKITPVPSAHEFLDRDPATGRYPYFGVILEVQGRTIYHSGDSCVYEGLLTRLKAWNFDVVLLPINGRSADQLSRNIIGNMTYQEAVDLAGNLGAALAIPTHWDMFEGNLGNPEDFLSYLTVKYPAVRGLRPILGETIPIPVRRG